MCARTHRWAVSSCSVPRLPTRISLAVTTCRCPTPSAPHTVAASIPLLLWRVNASTLGKHFAGKHAGTNDPSLHLIMSTSTSCIFSRELRGRCDAERNVVPCSLMMPPPTPNASDTPTSATRSQKMGRGIIMDADASSLLFPRHVTWPCPRRRP